MRADEPRLLARDAARAYTNDPRRALTHEPEAVDADHLEDLSQR